MAKNKKRISSLSAITIRIAAVIFAIWLLCMSAMTVEVAKQWKSTHTSYAGSFYFDISGHWRMQNVLDRMDEPPHPGYVECNLADVVNATGIYNHDHVESAVVFYSGDELIMHSFSNMHFQYSLEKNYDQYDGGAYIDLGKLSEETLDYMREMRMDRINPSGVSLRISGVLDGAEMIPQKIEMSKGNYPIKNDDYSTVYETERITGDTVIYVDHWRWNDYEPKLKVRHDELGNSDNILDFALDNAGETTNEYDSIWQVLNLRCNKIYNTNGWDQESTGEPPVAFYLVTAVVAKPMRAAVFESKNVYIFTFIIAVLVALLLRRSVKKNFTDPVKLVYKGVSDGWGYVATSLDSKTMWREPYEISRHYRETLDKLRADKNEIARLTTALEYAEEAEEQRRQMSSNIAHELKTPLAVIRSYAEGLQEHIAEEKRDKYLEVIVGETERMDELVLEMLELSRLEAGRVKLARDVCDLSALTRSVFEKLEPAAEAKELTITYQLQEDCLFSADEARILQVIGNFASNALRYTPVGGHIWVRTSMARGYVSLAVENTSPPLSDEVLGKVWERFWRAEESRSEKSSGLGLAIAKSIVELHGGKCSARNTENGVEFAFTI